jgi:hypothetical protein
MSPIRFRFIYEPEDDSDELDAYDAGQALFGISRSLALVTHYVVNGKVIKQAPSLSGARIMVVPPRAGSFEFLIQILPAIVDFAQQVAPSIAANLLYDLTKLLYRRSSGLSDVPETSELQELLRRVPGDIDAVNDAVDEDIVRIHRPFEGPVTILNIYGGVNHFGNFNRSTYEYAKARELGPGEETFTGNVASYNGNTDYGRLWMPQEQRTVAFRRDRTLKKLPQSDRALLSWSLDEYVNGREGAVQLIGRALRNREEKIKMMFVTGVNSYRVDA